MQRSAIISFRTAARDHAFVILQNHARSDAAPASTTSPR
jgi:hypothetical protein